MEIPGVILWPAIFAVAVFNLYSDSVVFGGNANSWEIFDSRVFSGNLGALIAVAAMIAAYFSQLKYANGEQKKHEWRQGLAIVLVLLSLLASGLGFWSAFQAIDLLSASDHAVY